MRNTSLRRIRRRSAPARLRARSALARLGSKADAPIETMPAYKLAAAKLADAQRAFRHSVVQRGFRRPGDAGEQTAARSVSGGGHARPSAWSIPSTCGSRRSRRKLSLTYARAGQPATITIDTYPNHVWHGVLQSRAPATDQEFAVLPAQNSSGNWVKVVQRVPLRVDYPERRRRSAAVSRHERRGVDRYPSQTHLGDLF